MASLKDLRNRIASVKATQKITKAMQMVAAAKLRRAQMAAEAARPFAERTIESADDSMEFKRLTGAEGVPVATLGTKPMIAFDPDEWNNGLDAAGYPQKSQLPRNFQQEPARPLTQKTTAAAAKQ